MSMRKVDPRLKAEFHFCVEVTVKVTPSGSPTKPYSAA